jgi:hypothetical protein
MQSKFCLLNYQGVVAVALACLSVPVMADDENAPVPTKTLEDTMMHVKIEGKASEVKEICNHLAGRLRVLKEKKIEYRDGCLMPQNEKDSTRVVFIFSPEQITNNPIILRAFRAEFREHLRRDSVPPDNLSLTISQKRCTIMKMCEGALRPWPCQCP